MMFSIEIETPDATSRAMAEILAQQAQQVAFAYQRASGRPTVCVCAADAGQVSIDCHEDVIEMDDELRKQNWRAQ